MSSQKNNMKNYSFRVFWYEPDKGYIATSPEFPDQSAFGETAEEAISQLKVALELAVQIYEEEGWPLPLPARELEYSGQFRLRTPKQLHAALVSKAEAEGVSLNTLVVTYLSQAVGRDDTLAQLRESLEVLVQNTEEIKATLLKVANKAEEPREYTLSAGLEKAKKQTILAQLEEVVGDESESKSSWLAGARRARYQNYN